jgi:hypothetical protein
MEMGGSRREIGGSRRRDGQKGQGDGQKRKICGAGNVRDISRRGREISLVLHLSMSCTCRCIS